MLRKGCSFFTALPLIAWGAPGLVPVQFNATTSAQPVGLHAEVLVDSAADLSVQEVMKSKSFKAWGQGVPNLGISRSAHWIMFAVENTTDEESIQLSIPHAEIDELDVYLVEEGAVRLIGRTGQSRPSVERIGIDPEFAFGLPVRPGMTVTVLVRVHGFKQIHVPLLLSGQAVQAQSRASRNLWLGGYAGIMIVMALYNLFVFASIRDRSYLIYVLYIAVICLAQFSVLGIGQAYLWPDSLWLSSRSSIVLVLGAVMLGMEFSRRFIGTKDYVPKLHKGVPLFYLAVAANILIYFLGDPWTGYMMAQAIGGWTALYLLVMVVSAMRKGSRQAGFFLLAWAFFLVGVVVFVLRDAGVLPYNEFTTYAMPIGSAVEGVLPSFALADRINILRKEKEQSQAEALSSAQENARITRDQNIILEQKVTERTEQLQLSLDQLKQAQSQLVEAEKMSSLGQLTAGIAHEINNPINYIRSNIPPLKRDMADLLEVLGAYRAHGAPENIAALELKLGLDETITEVHDILHSMEEGANRTAEIVRGLRSFSRLDEGDLKAADVNDGIRSTLNILGPQLKDRVQVELGLRAVEAVECYPGKLNQVFMNMLNNAVQAVVARHGTEGGRLQVISEQAEGHTVISILDNGTGMKPEVRARVFEPFFTTKAVGEGTGLGLSIAHSIIEKHNGRIEVDSVEGEGSMFRIILPNTQPMAMAKRA